MAIARLRGLSGSTLAVLRKHGGNYHEPICGAALWPRAFHLSTPKARSSRNSENEKRSLRSSLTKREH
jgi:hypothetical protein